MNLATMAVGAHANEADSTLKRNTPGIEIHCAGTLLKHQGLGDNSICAMSTNNMPSNAVITNE